jgi:phage tail-like protein
MAIVHPMPSYHFTVQWGGARIGFQEVSGLNIQADVVEFRDGSDPESHPRKMPGQLNYSNIVLKRGIVPSDNEFFAWINTIQLNVVERRDVVVQLLNHQHNPVMTWKIRNAFPVRYSGPVLSANTSEVAMEELELAHDGLFVEAT